MPGLWATTGTAAARLCPAPRCSHLPDSRAEAALKDSLEGLQFLRGQLPAALEPLEELHRPGHVCGAGAGRRDRVRDSDKHGAMRPETE